MMVSAREAYADAVAAERALAVVQVYFRSLHLMRGVRHLLDFWVGNT
jgi:hypothetical protein